MLLKQLLESELFNENDPEVQEQRMGRPELGYRTYPAIQQQTPNERFQPAYVHFTLFPDLILSMNYKCLMDFYSDDNFVYRKRQGGCLFHGGLAHNCDYKDLVGAVDEADHWGSDLSPGKV